jgi:hypothetical protein
MRNDVRTLLKKIEHELVLDDMSGYCEKQQAVLKDVVKMNKAFKTTIKINPRPYEATVQISKEKILGLFISACEGGSNYWCGQVDPIGNSKDAYEAMLPGFTVFDKEDGEKIKVTPEMIHKAVGLFISQCPYHFAKLMCDDEDALAGDAFLQLCTFGELVYG